MSQCSVQRILHVDMKLFLHKIFLVHKLPGQRDKINFFSVHVFLDKAYFHSDGTVNKQNMQLWEMEPPENFHNKSSHRAKATVWVAMSNHCLISPIFLHETVHSEQYLHMLHNNFLLQPMAQGLHLLTLWLMQDGAWPHSVNNVLDLFNAVFSP
jgi:hypothetical protein